jgi:hypothetical protein
VRWLVWGVLLLGSGGCIGQSLHDIVTTLDRSHIPSCVRADYRLRAGILAQAGDGVLVVYAAAGGADLAQCLQLLDTAP